MAFPIIPKKRSGATGSPTSLTVGELAVNTATGELFLGGDSAVLLLNPPTAAGTTTTERTGDGTTTAFTFSGYNGNADGGYLVSVGGIDQPPSKYSVSSTAGGTITFVEAPTAGEIISIRALVASSGGGGGGITELTGDVTASGTGSVAATLASITTAQSEVGSGTAVPVLSVDEKGRVTQLTTIAFAGLTTTQIAGLSTTAPAALATSAVVGLSTFAARADHQHVFPSAADVGALGATASASGDLTGNYPGPTLAAITTAQSNVGSSTAVPVLSIDAKGRVTSLSTAANPQGTVTSVAGGTGLTGGTITAAGTLAVSYGSTAGTAAQGNDARLSDSRTPSGAAGGDLGGTYPNPTLNTVAVSKGGTGQTSYTNGQLLIGNTTGNTLSKATLTAGTNVTITNGAGTITIAANASSSTGGAKAWINFNGSTSAGTIRSSFNVSSVTYNAAGDFTVNFTSAMTDANYSIIANASSDGSALCVVTIASSVAGVITPPTTAGFRLALSNLQTIRSPAYVTVAVFGN